MMWVEVAVSEGINIRVSMLGEWMRYLVDSLISVVENLSTIAPACDRTQVRLKLILKSMFSVWLGFAWRSRSLSRVNG